MVRLRVWFSCRKYCTFAFRLVGLFTAMIQYDTIGNENLYFTINGSTTNSTIIE